MPRKKIKHCKVGDLEMEIPVGDLRSVRGLIEHYELLVKLVMRGGISTSVFEAITKSMFGTNGAVELFRTEKVLKRI
ncbi:MAG: hypothetical protein QXS68_07485 [Candidatus Methanomethylicaceae archaeon]